MTSAPPKRQHRKPDGFSKYLRDWHDVIADCLDADGKETPNELNHYRGAHPEPAAAEYEPGRIAADLLDALKSVKECERELMDKLTTFPPPAPDRIGELEHAFATLQYRVDKRIAALEKRVTNETDNRHRQEQAFSGQLDALQEQIDHPAPAAPEHGEAITLHRWRVVEDGATGPWVSCYRDECLHDTEADEHGVIYEHRTARLDAPDADGREDSNRRGTIDGELKTRPESSDRAPEQTSVKSEPAPTISPAPRDDGPGERETFARAALKIALGHKHSTACQTGDDPHADCASVVGDAIVDAFVPPATAKAEAGEMEYGSETCYCGAPKQTIGGHRWNTALGCGSEPLNPDTWPPKQPEQTAPEARRVLMSGGSHQPHKRSWVSERHLGLHQRGPGCPDAECPEAGEYLPAAYHDAAMEQAKKDREAVVEVERIVDWLKHDLPYRAPELVGPDYAAELFKRLQRALGGPR